MMLKLLIYLPAEYVKGEPVSGHCENEEALFMPIDEVLLILQKNW